MFPFMLNTENFIRHIFVSFVHYFTVDTGELAYLFRYNHRTLLLKVYMPY